MTSLNLPAVDRYSTVETWPLPASLADAERLAARREALLALDPLVRRELQRAVSALGAYTVELTIYGAIYAASPEVGGHWTAASTFFGLLSHSVRTLAVSLLFDERDRPQRFVVSGARSVVSADTSEAALAAALEEALIAGPRMTITPNLFQQIGI